MTSFSLALPAALEILACANSAFACPSLATLGIAVIGALAMVIVANGSADADRSTSRIASTSKISWQIF